MAMAVIDVVGAIAGVVGVGMMIPGLIPKKDDHKPVVRVGVGMSSDVTDGLSGNQPGISLYDIMGRRIGEINGKKGKILDGDFMDISVPFDKNVGKKPAEYMSVVNGGDDALCIAYLALTQPDGDKKAWYGDVGKSCGADWYHSNLKTGDDDYQPACIWIHRSPYHGLRHQGFSLHINDFAGTDARAKQYDENRDLMCKAAPRFKMYETVNSGDPIPYFKPQLDYVPKDLTDVDPAAVLDKSRWVLSGTETKNVNKKIVDADPKRKAKRDNNNNNNINQAIKKFNNVVISDSKWHSAKDLCAHQNSAGHDFVSLHEGQMCDMSNRKVWPVCSATKKSGCFDTATSQMRPGAGLKGRDVDTGAYPPKKAYDQTVRWH